MVNPGILKTESKGEVVRWMNDYKLTDGDRDNCMFFAHYVMKMDDASSELRELAFNVVSHAGAFISKISLRPNDFMWLKFYYMKTYKLFVKEFGKTELVRYSLLTGHNLPFMFEEV